MVKCAKSIKKFDFISVEVDYLFKIISFKLNKVFFLLPLLPTFRQGCQKFVSLGKDNRKKRTYVRFLCDIGKGVGVKKLEK